MSDPVTNAEVEDVLASIRRLVSEEKRPKTPDSPRAMQDKLVLTPALRIAEDAPAQEDVPLDFEGGAEAPFAEDAIPMTENKARIAHFDPGVEDKKRSVLSSALGAIIMDEPSVLSTPAPAPAPMPSAEPVLDDAEPVIEAAAPEAEVSLEDDYSTDPYNFDDANDFDGEADLPGSFAEPEARADEPEPFAQQMAVEGPVEPEMIADDDTLDVIVEEEPEDTRAPAEPVVTPTTETAKQDQTVVSAPEVPAETPAKTVALSAKIAALETAISKIADTWEPDDPGDSDYAGTNAGPPSWEAQPTEAEDEAVARTASEAEVSQIEAAPAPDEVEPTSAPDLSETPASEVEEFLDGVSPGPSHQAEAATPHEVAAAAVAPAPALMAEAAPSDGIDLTDQEQLIDEDALRDLVSEIVRAELQGALGERITRNVRKLVRREIHRALTAQELE